MNCLLNTCHYDTIKYVINADILKQIHALLIVLVFRGGLQIPNFNFVIDLDLSIFILNKNMTV